jgi:magnesium transporter
LSSTSTRIGARRRSKAAASPPRLHGAPAAVPARRCQNRQVLQIWVYGKEGARDAERAELAGLLERGDETVWVDIAGPDDECVHLLAEVFKFHPLAIEDTRNQRQRPKAEEYPDHLFLILNPATTANGKPHFRELDVFLGRGFVVTVHPGEEPVIEVARQRVGSGRGASAGHVLYTLLDVVVDQYFPILDDFGERLEEIEERLLAHPSRWTLARLFKMKRDLLDFRRVVGPQRDMFNLLTRRDLGFIDHQQLQFQLRDVYDHLLRITDLTDSHRELLTSSIDLYMSAVSNRLNAVVNRLTVLTVLIGTLGVIVGFYGMNFQRTWPPFEASWGVPFTLALMAAAVAIGVWLFRQREMM